MSYSMKKYPDREYEFPAPPVWLVWCSDVRRVKGANTYGPEGQVRHLESLQKCKKYVSPGNYNGGKFWRDWSIYCWDGTKYILCYSGEAGQHKSTNPLFQKKVKADASAREIEVDDAELEAVILSITKRAM